MVDQSAHDEAPTLTNESRGFCHERQRRASHGPTTQSNPDDLNVTLTGKRPTAR